MAALGDILYRASSLWARLAGNTTATRKYLSQTGTGAVSAAPSWNQVTDADLSTSNITTNDVSITKHGFAPKAPNDATKFLDGTGAYSVPASGGTFSGAKVRKSTNQTGADYTAGVMIAFDSEDYDTNFYHDNVTNNTRLTVPSGVTKVRITFSVVLTNVTLATQSRLELFKNGSVVDGGDQIGASIDVSRVFGFTVDHLVSAADFFEVKLTQQTDTSIDILAARTSFSIQGFA